MGGGVISHDRLPFALLLGGALKDSLFRMCKQDVAYCLPDETVRRFPTNERQQHLSSRSLGFIYNGAQEGMG